MRLLPFLLVLGIFAPADAETTAITYGQTLSGTLGANEQDVYTFTAPADGEIFARLVTLSGDAVTNLTVVRVSSGTVATSGNSGIVATVEQQSVVSGQSYELHIPPNPTGPSYPGKTYRVYLQSVTAPVGATAVPLNGGGSGTLSQEGQVDFYTVPAQDGDLLRVSVSRTAGTVDPSAVFYIPTFGSCTPEYNALDGSDNPTVVTDCADFIGTGNATFTIEDVNDSATEDVDGIETGGYAFAVTCVSGPCLALVTTTTTSTSSTTSSSSTTTTTTSTVPATADQLLPGTKLVLRDKAGKAKKRKLTAVAKTPLAVADPRTAGATLRVQSTTFDATYALPGGSWKPSGDGFKYEDAKRAAGPIVSAKLTSKLLKLAGKGDALVTDLAANPAPVRIALTVGDVRYCLEYGGGVAWVPSKKLVAKAAPAGSCP